MIKTLLSILLPLFFLMTAPVDAACQGSDRSSNNWDVSVDFLGLFASQETSAIWADVITVGLNESAFGAENFSFDWDFGIRLEAGREICGCPLDTQLSWTCFHTDSTKSISVPVGGGSIHPEFFAADLSGIFSQSATIQWALRYNMFDWVLGYTCCMGKKVTVRPYFGCKGGWIRQPIEVQYTDLTINNVVTDEIGYEKLKNNFWGIGPLGGVQAACKLFQVNSHVTSLVGDFSCATLWGTWLFGDRYNDTTGKEVIVNLNKATLGALMFRGFLGLGWDVICNRNGSHLSFEIGYEMQLWLNQLRLPTSQLIVLHGDLTLQGVTINCGYHF